MNCDKEEIPNYLHQGDRKVDNNFSDDELLYRRFHKDFPPNFTTKEMSVNRQKYSHEPEDVLYDINTGQKRINFGIAQFRIRNLNTLRIPHPTIQNTEYTLEIVHAPIPCMYPHANVYVKKSNVRLNSLEGPKTVKDEIRAFYTDNFEIIRNESSQEPNI
ncbi:hypothetical protein [Leptospira kirschneri]|uniref:hypothetical protein n=1 Tax=Leptospira kirschneri TaxID=29507 RepID=UPI003562142A